MMQSIGNCQVHTVKGRQMSDQLCNLVFLLMIVPDSNRKFVWCNSAWKMRLPLEVCCNCSRRRGPGDWGGLVRCTWQFPVLAGVMSV